MTLCFLGIGQIAFAAKDPIVSIAVILMPAENIDMPKGSHIPEHRSKEIEKKMREHKKMMKGTYAEQEQESPRTYSYLVWLPKSCT